MIIRRKESIKICDSEKVIRPNPNIAADRGIILPNIRTFFFAARYIAPVKAPMPDAPMRNPKVWELPCKISFENMGSSIIYGMPDKLTMASRRIIDLIGANPNV